MLLQLDHLDEVMEQLYEENIDDKIEAARKVQPQHFSALCAFSLHRLCSLIVTVLRPVCTITACALHCASSIVILIH